MAEVVREYDGFDPYHLGLVPRRTGTLVLGGLNETGVGGGSVARRVLQQHLNILVLTNL